MGYPPFNNDSNLKLHKRSNKSNGHLVKGHWIYANLPKDDLHYSNCWKYGNARDAERIWWRVFGTITIAFVFCWFIPWYEGSATCTVQASITSLCHVGFHKILNVKIQIVLFWLIILYVNIWIRTKLVLIETFTYKIINQS